MRILYFFSFIATKQNKLFIEPKFNMTIDKLVSL